MSLALDRLDRWSRDWIADGVRLSSMAISGMLRPASHNSASLAISYSVDALPLIVVASHSTEKILIAIFICRHT